MDQTIGKQLAQKREGDGISVEDVAHRTRIPADVVRRLENDDFSGFPNLVYARSFLRMYCSHLGVDGTPILEELRRSGEVKPARSSRPAPLYFRSQVTQSEMDAIGEARRGFEWFPWRPILSALFLAAVLGSGSYVVYGLWSEHYRHPPVADATPGERDAGAPEENLIGGDADVSPAVDVPVPAATGDGETTEESDGEEIVLRAVPIEPQPAPAPDAASTGSDEGAAAVDSPPLPTEGPGVSSNAPVEDPDAVAALRSRPPASETPSGNPPRDPGPANSESTN